MRAIFCTYNTRCLHRWCNCTKEETRARGSQILVPVRLVTGMVKMSASINKHALCTSTWKYLPWGVGLVGVFVIVTDIHISFLHVFDHNNHSQLCFLLQILEDNTLVLGKLRKSLWCLQVVYHKILPQCEMQHRYFYSIKNLFLFTGRRKTIFKRQHISEKGVMMCGNMQWSNNYKADCLKMLTPSERIIQESILKPIPGSQEETQKISIVWKV